MPSLDASAVDPRLFSTCLTSLALLLPAIRMSSRPRVFYWAWRVGGRDSSQGPLGTIRERSEVCKSQNEGGGCAIMAIAPVTNQLPQTVGKQEHFFSRFPASPSVFLFLDHEFRSRNQQSVYDSPTAACIAGHTKQVPRQPIRASKNANTVCVYRKLDSAILVSIGRSGRI